MQTEILNFIQSTPKTVYPKVHIILAIYRRRLVAISVHNELTTKPQNHFSIVNTLTRTSLDHMGVALCTFSYVLTLSHSLSCSAVSLSIRLHISITQRSTMHGTNSKHLTRIKRIVNALTDSHPTNLYRAVSSSSTLLLN